MKLNDSTDIISVKLINSNDNSEKLLYEREGRKCHFAEMFGFGDYRIQLRLDCKSVRS